MSASETAGAAAGAAGAGLVSGALASGALSARALTLFAEMPSATPQLPSSAADISPLARGGQSGRLQEAPSALFTTSAASSSRPAKKLRHSGSRLPGSVS